MNRLYILGEPKSNIVIMVNHCAVVVGPVVYIRIRTSVHWKDRYRSATPEIYTSSVFSDTYHPGSLKLIYPYTGDVFLHAYYYSCSAWHWIIAEVVGLSYTKRS